MGIYKHKRCAPVLWQGPHLTGILSPVAGRNLVRDAFANYRPISQLETPQVGRRNLWCYFTHKRDGRVIVKINGRKLGTVDFESADTSPGLREALNSGITGATVYLHKERDGWHAQIDVGDHRFMPRPYWR